MEEGNKDIHIKISAEFSTFDLLPFAIAGVDCRCTLKIENTGKTKLPETDFRWKIESEDINLGGRKESTGSFDDIYRIKLEPGEKKKDPLAIRLFIPGHHKLVVGIPDSEKGGNAIVGELMKEEVAGTPKQKQIRFHGDPGMDFPGPWYTYFEGYSWYLVAIGLGTLSAFMLIIIEIFKAVF